MGHIYAGIPKDLVLEVLKKEKIKWFIETGTNAGNTAIWAAQHFEHVYTIEIMEEYSRQAANRPDSKKNIRFLIGNSINVLPSVIKEINNNAMFWLDGHYSGGDTGGVDYECPVMGEIEKIAECKNALILIDDARCFFGPPPPPHKADQWPGIAEIFVQLNKYFPSHYSTIVDDVIYCVPHKFKATMDKDWLNHFEERFILKEGEADNNNTLLKKIKTVFSNI